MGIFRQVKASVEKGKLGKEIEYSKGFSDYTKEISEATVTGFARRSRYDLNLGY